MTTATRKITKAERKDWAREHFLGAEGVLLPSFTPDLKDLDEEGIRRDVRKSIDHGFFSSFVTAVGLTPEERRRFTEIAADEAGDRILLSSGGGGGGSLEAAVAQLENAQRIGLSHVMFSLPSGPGFETEDAVFDYSSKLIETTDLGIVLYAQSGDRYKRFHPGNVPLKLFARLAELPNVVGAKLTQVLDPVMTYECCERLGDKMLLGGVNLEHLPFMATMCQVQWTGMWAVECCQSPDKQYVVDYLKLLAGKRIEEATALYWQFRPLIQLFWDEQAEVLRHGGHPWTHLKYHSWAVGGNGGLLRHPAGSTATHDFPLMTAEDRQRVRDTYAACGITTSANDDEFVVGRSAYARGIRPSLTKDAAY